MNDIPRKINNSYESASSSSSASSGNDPLLDKSNQLEDMEGYKLMKLMLLPENGNELCNSSVEEGIFPNVSNHARIDVPSYEPNYSYEMNEYSNNPLVYSWLPIVPGFIGSFDNLHKFQHLSDSKTMNISSGSMESQSVSNQNEKYHEHLVINNRDKTLNSSSEMIYLDLENSCNAMDLNISCSVQPAYDPNVSFNGMIAELKALNKSPKEKTEVAVEVVKEEVANESFGKEVEQTEEERLHNESFEHLKKEDSSKMLYINEKSPELFENDADAPSDNEPAIVDKSAATNAKMEVKSSEDCDTAIVKKLRASISGIAPPPCVTRFQLSLSEIISTYKKNVHQNPPIDSAVTCSSFFVPSHDIEEVKSMEWPQLLSVKSPGLSHNRNLACEKIEVLCMNYGERFIGAETMSSFNLKVGPSSAKKRTEKLKLLTQSPGSRLNHLTKRRTTFSSANLKSNLSLNSSQSTSGAMMINTSKLYSKARAKSPRKRTSAKKKTPGKRKTPKSAKRQLVTRPETSRVTSKRALFTSPIQSKKVELPPKEVASRGRLPRRSLFSPDENKKRKMTASPDQDAENRFGKQRRLESPTRMPKSLSFSIGGTSSASMLDTLRVQPAFYRTQSVFENLNSSTSSTITLNLGYKKPLTEEIRNKLLWAVSSALKINKISKEHAKFKEHASKLAKLVKRIFQEFYNPAVKSVSEELSKFATFMVSFVIQEKPFEEIYTITKVHLQSKNTRKVSGYIAQQEYERNHLSLIRRNSSLMMSRSASSLNLSQQSEGFFDSSSINSSRLSGSNSSLNQSASSVNNDVGALRSIENSGRKFGGSESNLSKQKSTSSTSLMKAKRQISF